MPYFKPHTATRLNRPVTHWVLVVQFAITLIVGVVCGLYSLINGLAVLLGGAISISGQAFYNYRALSNYGDSFTANIVTSTYSAMWGKWLIIIASSLAIVITIEELNAGVLYASVFGIHTIGALLIPVLVKRVA